MDEAEADDGNDGNGGDGCDGESGRDDGSATGMDQQLTVETKSEKVVQVKTTSTAFSSVLENGGCNGLKSQTPPTLSSKLLDLPAMDEELIKPGWCVT